ncbi:hypothetical protein ABEF95_004625 [Exophiala dermatitidis]
MPGIGPPKRPRIYQRSGCRTCKARHKKCDGQEPRCANCTRLGLECKTQEIFRFSTQTSLYAEKKRRCAKDPDPTEEESTNVKVVAKPTSTDIVLCFPAQDSIRRSSFDSRLPSPTRAISTMPQISATQHYLLQHYVERSSSVLLNVDGLTNNLRTLILPRVFGSSMLINAIFATSAGHLYIFNKNPEHRTGALTYYNKAAADLQNLIAKLESDITVADRESALLTSVFLCKYEIVSGGLNHWRSHLHGLQKMFSLFQQHDNGVSQNIASYVRSFIAYHRYMAGLTGSEESPPSPATSDDTWDMEAAIAQNGVDPYMGFSYRYISLLCSSARFAMTEFSECEPPLNEITRLVRSIKSDASSAEPSQLSSKVRPDVCMDLCHIASAYRQATVVYLHEVLDKVSGSRANDVSVLQALRLRSLLPGGRDEAMSSCMAHISKVDEESLSAFGLAPLLFIVASESRDWLESCDALDRLARIWKKTGLGNLGTAVDLLSTIREEHIMNWRQVLKRRHWDLIVS